MRFCVISDLHLGFGFGTEREGECFEQAQDALEKALNHDPDFILLAGDIFDSRIPRPEVWARALEILKLPLTRKNGVSVEGVNKKVEHFWGIPVIAIHGTHERRGAKYVNPVQTLEKAGYLIHLHANGVLLRKGGENVFVYGFSGVPERLARDVLRVANPKPIDGAFNIFMFHQNLVEFMYGDEGLSISDLPAGFDLYIDGHIHAPAFHPDQKLLLPGSTIVTQMRKGEEERKGFYVVETDPFEVTKVEIKQRPFFYFEMDACNHIEEVVKQKLAALPENALVKIKIKGKLNSALSEAEIRKGFGGLVYIDFETGADELKRKIELLRKVQEEKKSMKEKAMDILMELLQAKGYDGPNVFEIFDMLEQGDIDAVLDIFMRSPKEGGQEEEKEENGKGEERGKFKGLAAWF